MKGVGDTGGLKRVNHVLFKQGKLGAVLQAELEDDCFWPQMGKPQQEQSNRIGANSKCKPDSTHIGRMNPTAQKPVGEASTAMVYLNNWYGLRHLTLLHGTVMTGTVLDTEPVRILPSPQSVSQNAEMLKSETGREAASNFQGSTDVARDSVARFGWFRGGG